MSTDLDLRGVPGVYPYKFGKSPNKKKRDWPNGFIAPWIILDADQLDDDCRVADYSDVLQRVQMTSPDDDHYGQSRWMRDLTQMGIIEPSASRKRQEGTDIEIVGYPSGKLASAVLRRSAMLAAARKVAAKRRVERNEVSNVAVEPRFVIRITGELISHENGQLEIAWYGGDTFKVAITNTVGFEGLSVGEWFEGVIVRLKNGDVQQVLLTCNAGPPEMMSEDELAEAYSQIPAADLDPID